MSLSSDSTSNKGSEPAGGEGFQLILHKGGDFASLWRQGADQRKAEGSRLLWIFSGPWRRQRAKLDTKGQEFDPSTITTPFAFWDGQHLVSNLRGIGLRRRFGHTTVAFYHSPWQTSEECALQNSAKPKASSSQPLLLVPSYDVSHSQYFDGCVWGFFCQKPPAQPRFILPLGRYSYTGPFAPCDDHRQQPSHSPYSPLMLRAPLVAALAEWLHHRYAQSLVEVLIDPSDCHQSQALCLVYLAMAGCCAVVDVPEDLEPQPAKGFKALSRNLGFYVGKAQPPPYLTPYGHRRQLSLSLLVPLLIDPTRVASCIAEFNSHSHLIPSSLTDPA